MENNKKNENSTEALYKLVIDVYKAECKKTFRYRIAVYVLIGLLFISVLLSCFLLNELNSYDQIAITTTTKTETFNNDVEGDEANIVNGDQYQYNDSAVHNDNNKEVD